MGNKTAAWAMAGAGALLVAGVVWVQGSGAAEPTYWEQKQADLAAEEAVREAPEVVLARFVAEELPNPCDGLPGQIAYESWLDEEFENLPTEYRDAYHDLDALVAAECPDPKAEPVAEPEWTPEPAPPTTLDYEYTTYALRTAWDGYTESTRADACARDFYQDIFDDMLDPQAVADFKARVCT